MKPIERIGEALLAHGCRCVGGMWTCPAHEDRHPSLSLGEGEDGRGLVHCFAGCATADVLGALGLGLADLFDGPRRAGRVGASPPPPRRPEPRCRIGLPTSDDLFWSQPEALIEAHFAALLAADPGPTDEQVARFLASRRGGEL